MDAVAKSKPRGAASVADAESRLEISGNVPKPFSIPMPHTVSVGRAKENVVTLPDNVRVSRFHAIIRKCSATEYQVVDLGSRNGTFVNEERVALPCKVPAGAQIGVGDVRLVLRLATGAFATPPLSQSPASSTACKVVASLDTFSSATPSDSDHARWLGRFFRSAGHFILSGNGWIDKFRDSSIAGYWEERETKPGCAQLAMEAALAILNGTNELEPPPGRKSCAGVTIHMGEAHWPADIIDPGEPLSGPVTDIAFELDALRRSEGIPFLLTEPCLALLPDHLLLKLNDVGNLRYGTNGKSIRAFGLTKV
jgi:adenylate cyclase